METTILTIAVTFALLVVLHVLRAGRAARVATMLGIAVAIAMIPAPSVFNTPLVANDGLAAFFATIFLLVGFIVVLASKETSTVYYGALLLSTLGMVVAGASRDLLLLYIAIELVTVPLYALVAYGKTRSRLEAATKYFIVSIVASAFFLLGIVLLSVSSGSTSTITQLDVFSLLGLVAILTGIGFKVGIFPFNFWIPDVYQGAPPLVAGLLSAASKKAGIVALIRVAVLFPPYTGWVLIFGTLAALTMTIPNIMALVQKNVKRMVAYSIMTHAGFLLMGLVVLSPVSLAGLLTHAFVHAFMALGAFLVLAVFAAHKLHTIDDLQGMGWRNPYLSAALTVFLLSLAGIPLLAGFSSKLFLFYSVAKDGLLWLVFLAIVNSGISLYYYFTIIRSLYGYPSRGKPYIARHSLAIAVGICVGIIVFLGLYPQPLFTMASAVASSLF